MVPVSDEDLCAVPYMVEGGREREGENEQEGADFVLIAAHTCRMHWCVPVVPATWEAEVEGCLSSGVQGHPGAL
jgi:hypothetical protein